MVIPRVRLSEKYIKAELEEMEREDNFRLKRFKELKFKKAGGGDKVAVCSICKSEIKKKDICDVCNTCEETRKRKILVCPLCEEGDMKDEPPKKRICKEDVCSCSEEGVGDVIKEVCPQCQKNDKNSMNVCSCEKVDNAPKTEINKSDSKEKKSNQSCACKEPSESTQINMDDLFKVIDWEKIDKLKEIYLQKKQQKQSESTCSCAEPSSCKQMNMEDLCKIIDCEKINQLKKVLQKDNVADVKATRNDDVCKMCLNNKQEDISREICPICGKDLTEDKTTNMCSCNHSFTCFSLDNKISENTLCSNCKKDKDESKSRNFSDPVLTHNRNTCNQCQKEGTKKMSNKNVQNECGTVCPTCPFKNNSTTSDIPSDTSKKGERTLCEKCMKEEDDAKNLRIQFTMNTKNEGFNTTPVQKTDDLLKVSSHIDEIINLTSKYKTSDSVEKFVDVCKDAKSKINQLPVQEDKSKSNVDEKCSYKNLQDDSVKPSNTGDNQGLGVFVTKFQEVVTVKRFKNEDGTIKETRQVITIKTETTNPSQTALSDNRINKRQSRHSSAASSIKQKGSTCSSQSGKVLKITLPHGSPQIKTSQTSSTISKDASIGSYTSCTMSSGGDVDSINQTECCSTGAQTEYQNTKNLCSKCKLKAQEKATTRSMSETSSTDTRTSNKCCALHKSKNPPSKSCVIKLVPKTDDTSVNDKELASNCLELLKKILLEGDQSTASGPFKSDSRSVCSCNSKKSSKSNITTETNSCCSKHKVQNAPAEKGKAKTCCMKEKEETEQKVCCSADKNQSDSNTQNQCKCKAELNKKSSCTSCSSCPASETRPKAKCCNTFSSAKPIQFCVTNSPKNSVCSCKKDEEKPNREQSCICKKPKESDSSSNKTCSCGNKGSVTNNHSESCPKQDLSLCQNCSNKSDARKVKTCCSSMSVTTPKSSCSCVSKNKEPIKKYCQESENESLNEKSLCQTCRSKLENKSTSQPSKSCCHRLNNIQNICYVSTPTSKPCCMQPQRESSAGRKSSLCLNCSPEPPSQDSCACNGKNKLDPEDENLCSTCKRQSSNESQNIFNILEPWWERSKSLLSNLKSSRRPSQNICCSKERFSTCPLCNPEPQIMPCGCQIKEELDNRTNTNCTSCGSPITPEFSRFTENVEQSSEKCYCKTVNTKQECCVSNASKPNQPQNVCFSNLRDRSVAGSSHTNESKSKSCCCKSKEKINIVINKTISCSAITPDKLNCSCPEKSKELNKKCYSETDNNKSRFYSSPGSLTSCCNQTDDMFAAKKSSICRTCSDKLKPKEPSCSCDNKNKDKPEEICISCGSPITEESTGHTEKSQALKGNCCKCEKEENGDLTLNSCCKQPQVSCSSKGKSSMCPACNFESKSKKSCSFKSQEKIDPEKNKSCVSCGSPISSESSCSCEENSKELDNKYREVNSNNNLSYMSDASFKSCCNQTGQALTCPSCDSKPQPQSSSCSCESKDKSNDTQEKIGHSCGITITFETSPCAHKEIAKASTRKCCNKLDNKHERCSKDHGYNGSKFGSQLEVQDSFCSCPDKGKSDYNNANVVSCCSAMVSGPSVGKCCHETDNTKQGCCSSTSVTSKSENKEKSSNCPMCKSKMQSKLSCTCNSKDKSGSGQGKKCSSCGVSITPKTPACTDKKQEKKCSSCGVSITPKAPSCTCAPQAREENKCLTSGVVIPPEPPSCTCGDKQKEAKRKCCEEPVASKSECCAPQKPTAPKVCCETSKSVDRSASCPNCSSKKQPKDPSCSCSKKSEVKQSPSCPKCSAVKPKTPSCTCGEKGKQQTQKCCEHTNKQSSEISVKSLKQNAQAKSSCTCKNDAKKNEQAKTCSSCGTKITPKPSPCRCIKKSNKCCKKSEAETKQETSTCPICSAPTPPPPPPPPPPQESKCVCKKKEEKPEKKCSCPPPKPDLEKQCSCPPPKPEPEKQCTCKDKTEASPKPDADSKVKTTPDTKAKEPDTNQCPDCAAKEKDEPKCTCKDKTEATSKPDVTAKAKSTTFDTKAKDSEANQCPVCAAKEEDTKCSCKTKSDTKQKSDNSCKKPCCASSETKSIGSSRKDRTQTPTREKSSCSCPSIRDIKKCSDKSRSSIDISVKESCPICEPKTKEAGTSTRRSDRYDVRNLEMITPPEPPKKKVCSCSSESYIAMDNWGPHVPTRANSYHGRCYH